MATVEKPSTSFSLQLPTADELGGRKLTGGPRKKAVRGPIPAELPLEKVVAVIDTREQLPHDLWPLKMVTDTLKTGDYSIRGLENYVAIERKSLVDFLACVGIERERFEACVQRLMSYPCRAIVIEASWADLEAGQWRSKVLPSAALGSVLSWIARGVPVVLSETREKAAKHVINLLLLAARQRWRECRELIVAAERIE